MVCQIRVKTEPSLDLQIGVESVGPILRRGKLLRSAIVSQSAWFAEKRMDGNPGELAGPPRKFKLKTSARADSPDPTLRPRLGQRREEGYLSPIRLNKHFSNPRCCTKIPVDLNRFAAQ